MATIHTGPLLVLSLLLFFPLPSTPIELYVTPSPSIPCHAHPCHTLSEYVENATEYFVSNTTLIFLPGEHTLKVQVNITNVTGFSMVGDPENTSLILCSESECGGFYFENVSCLNISNLSFTSNGHSINTVDVYNFQIVSCTFANSSNTALIAHNSNLLLEGNTFVTNSGGKISQTVFMPGGGIAVVYSNMTLQGHNIFLDNTCSADKCGGGAVYAEHSTVNLEGNTSFIHNTAISGGGASLLYSTVNISGRVTFSNNMVNGSGESGNGGGLYLYDSSVIITGRVTLTDNYASYAGGGIDMLEGNMNISGSVTLTDNYAGFAGGGINMMESNMSTSGTVSLTNNSACSFGGGINTLNGGVSIMGSVFLIDNHAGFNGGGHGGGMRVQGSTVNIIGTVTFARNSADLQGGGIDLYEGCMSVSGTVTLTNNSACYFNITKSFGGGISVLNGGVSITGSVIFTNNYAGCNGGGNGGGMSMEGSTMNVAGTTLFSNNSADLQGGGIIITVSSLTISGYLSFNNNLASSFGGGILLLAGSNITMENATLTDNYAGYQGGGILVQGGNMIITGRTSIVNNSAGKFGGGLLVINSNVDIPGTMSVINNSALAYGGGITTVDSTVTISGCILLTDNHAGYYSHSTGSAYGGGVVSQGSTLNVTGSTTLTNNFADLGGGIFITSSSMSGSGSVSITNNSASLMGGGIQVVDSNITIRNVLLSDNHALQGGGISTQGKTVLAGNVSIFDNSGNSGGGLVIFQGNMDITGTVSLTRNLAGIAGGGIAISSGNISILSGSLLLTDNMARSESGGIDMQYSSTLSVTHLASVVLNNNSASLGGGGIRLDGRSQLVINGMMNFTNNYASQGGALFVNDDTPLLYCSSDVGAVCVIEDCFFQSDSFETFLVFEGNVAEEGSVLYGGSVDRCRLEGYPGMQSSEAFDKIANYSLQPHTLSTITSNPFRVCFCNNSQPNSSGISNITAYPGQTFITTVAAVGQRNGTMYAIVSAVAKPIQVSSLGVFEDRQSVDDKCTELHYTFFSNVPFINLMMYVDGSCSSLDGSVNRLNIPVYLLSCPPAFKLSEPPCGCICEDRLQKYTNSCDINNQTIYRDGDFWVGYDNQSHGLILHPHCPFDYCQTKPINFTLNETDRQCQHDHTGLLCGACKPGLSLTLGGSQCLPCSDTYLFLLLPFAVMGLVIVLFLLVIRLTVKVGTVSGLIFYASIVGANQNTFFPPGSTNFLAANVFISWIKLDLGITTCFYDGMDAYAKTWLQFVFPIYIWGVIGLIIFISRHSTIMTRMLKSNPIEVLATVFILSYGKILRTIISALSFTTLEYPNNETQLVWLYDANVMYLHGKHIPLFVVGLLFFALVYLPFTLLLLLGQWLQALSHLRILSWMNNQNLKTILDTYHAPYNKDYRYWPGLLLVIRFALLLVFASNALRDNSGNLLAITAASFVLLVWPWTIGSLYKNQYFGVYKNKYFGVLEASYILNLGILAAATNYVQQAGGNQAAVAYTSTGIAFLTFILIIIYHIYLQTKNFQCWKTLCSTLRKDQRQGNGHDERNIPVVNAENAPLVTHTTLRVNYGADQLREPLLDDQ